MEHISKSAAAKILKNKRFPKTLFKQGFTVLMPYENAMNWLNALRDGTFIQTNGVLHSPKSGGFCCLGVEQYVNNDEKVECDSYGSFEGLPSFDYHENMGYLHVDNRNFRIDDVYIPSLDKFIASLNDDMIEKTGANQYGDFTTRTHRYSFNELADQLESVIVTY